MSYQAVIFDLDGVLVDSEPLYLEFFQQFILNHGYTVDDVEIRRLVGLNNHQDFELINAWMNYHFADYETYAKALGEHQKISKPVDYSEVVNEGLLELLMFIKSKGLKIGLASASSKESIERALKQAKVTTYFDYYLSGHDVSRSKPHPDIYLEVAKHLNVEPKDCLVIEDSFNGIKSAKAAGMFVIAKKEERYGFSQAEADLIIEDLTRFPFEMLEKE